MRNLFAGAATGFKPRGFKPYQSHLPHSTENRLSQQTHLVDNPTNPGYAYGTVIPLTATKVGLVRWYLPWTIPVAKTFHNGIRMRPQIHGVTMDPTRRQRVLGSVTNVPGRDYSGVHAIQARLAAARR